ncbi:Uncharacterised protein [Shigella sonnei]|nr:Uncharacterised protein [Shigella sonnei]
MTKGDAVFFSDRARNRKPRFQWGRGLFRRFFAVHIQLTVREAKTHTGKSVGDKTQSSQPPQFR